MALTPLNKSRRVQVTKFGAQPETDRAVHQYGNPGRNTSMRCLSSRLFAKAQAYATSPEPNAPSVVSGKSFEERLDESFVHWMRRDWYFDGYSRTLLGFGFEDLVLAYCIQCSGLTTTHARFLLFNEFLGEFQRCLEEDRKFYSTWDGIMTTIRIKGAFGAYCPPRRYSWEEVEKVAEPFRPKLARVFENKPKINSDALHENYAHPDDSWDRDSWVKVEKAAKPFRLRLARVFEYTPIIGLVALHKGHAHPDGIPTLEDTNGDVELLSNDLMGRELVERWKAGPGRKKAWRTAPRLRFSNKDRTRLLRCSQQREVTLRSCSTLLRNSGFISLSKQASINSSVPIVLLEHGMARPNGSQSSPMPSVLKNAVRRFRLSTSNMSRPRTRSKPFPPKAVRLVDGDSVDGGDGVDCFDDEEADDDSFDLGPSNGYFEGDRFSDMGNDM